MDEQRIAVAMTMKGNPGVYALLIGSGVSRSAQVPMGWDIICHLIRDMAAIRKEDCGADPEGWYKKTFGKDPSYSDLLEQIGGTGTERRGILLRFFEPTAEDRAEKRKVPTLAHQSIAELVKRKIVRVILTTNFDRLIEQALEAAGASPKVIHRPEEADPVLLTHEACLVIKLHGDYLDLETKNTGAELTQYDPKMNQLLERVFSEYGLLICGWSGEWDTALRDALMKNLTPRYSTYWTVYDPLKDLALRCAETRKARMIQVREGADKFFGELKENIEAMIDRETLVAMSGEVAVTRVKKYLADPRYRIDLSDLVMGEIDRVVKEVTSDKYPVDGPDTEGEYQRRIQAFETASRTAMSILATGVYWGEESHREVWKKAFLRLTGHCILLNPTGGSRLQWYPALLGLYAAGLGAFAAGKIDTLMAILEEVRVKKGRDGGREMDLVYTLLIQVPEAAFTALPEYKGKVVALNQQLLKTLRETLRAYIPEDGEYKRLYNEFEVLLSLRTYKNDGWVSPGLYMYETHSSFLQTDLGKDIKSMKYPWGNVAARWFDKPGDFNRAVEEIDKKAKQSFGSRLR